MGFARKSLVDCSASGCTQSVPIDETDLEGRCRGCQPARLTVPLAGALDVGRLQVIPKRDVDAALATSTQLAAVVVKLVRLVEEQGARIERLEERLNSRHGGKS